MRERKNKNLLQAAMKMNDQPGERVADMLNKKGYEAELFKLQVELVIGASETAVIFNTAFRPFMKLLQTPSRFC